MASQIQKVECPYCKWIIEANTACCPMCGLDLPVDLPLLDLAEAEAKERARVKELVEARTRAKAAAQSQAEIEAKQQELAQAEKLSRERAKLEEKAHAAAKWARIINSLDKWLIRLACIAIIIAALCYLWQARQESAKRDAEAVKKDAEQKLDF